MSGKFNAEYRYIAINITMEYIHANLGWGPTNLTWVDSGVYVFEDTNYNGSLEFLEGIYPRPY